MDGARTKQNLRAGSDRMLSGSISNTDANSPTPLQLDAQDVRVGEDPEVAPPTGRTQECVGGAEPFPAPDRPRLIAKAAGLDRFEIIDVRNRRGSKLFCRANYRITQWVTRRMDGDSERTAASAKWLRRQFVVFESRETRADFVPSPTGAACSSQPS